jgi:adenylate kinase
LAADNFHFTHFSTGDLLRSIKDSDPEIEEIMKRGDMVPDPKVVNLIEKHLTENNQYDNMIIDGSPRNLYQYLKLKDFFASHGAKINLAVCISISDKEAIKRITARRLDKKTGKIYNLITNPPDLSVNPENLVQREDDMEEAVKERLKIQKIPNDLLVAVRDDGILFNVDGEGSIDKIHHKIAAEIRKYLTN